MIGRKQGKLDMTMETSYGATCSPDCHYYDVLVNHTSSQCLSASPAVVIPPVSGRCGRKGWNRALRRAVISGAAGAIVALTGAVRGRFNAETSLLETDISNVATKDMMNEELAIDLTSAEYGSVDTDWYPWDYVAEPFRDMFVTVLNPQSNATFTWTLNTTMSQDGNGETTTLHAKVCSSYRASRP